MGSRGVILGIAAARKGLGRALIMPSEPADAAAILLEAARETEKSAERPIPTR